MALLKPLTDVAEAAERLGTAVVRMEGVPGDERQQYRNVVAETFDVLQQAISFPANRLSKILNVPEAKFADELAALADFGEWERLERAAYLCEPLRAAGREMDGLLDKVKGHLATRDWKRLRELTERLLGGEPEFAYLITSSLQRLSAMAEEARSSQAGYRKAQKAVKRYRDHLQQLRQLLLAKQLEFYNAI